ncbi:MAG: hypothetical protein HC780_28740 [Leptolyngbyaceae cyanobacterium CSU_1_3]|nr:hypothetical protein [Leptolyngbyaceae cyanobacterium CSU_1_3]
MSKFKRNALISAICLMGVVFWSWTGVSQIPQPAVHLTTHPALSQIKPFEAEATRPQSPVQLMLQAKDAASQPLENAKMRLQILTRPKNPWFTTDFPITEGTTLLDMEAPAPKGELQLQQMLPIRGTYKLLVNVTPITANAFTPIQQTLTLSVAESWVKYRNFGVLAAILLAAGLGGGWVIGSRQPTQPGKIAPQRVRMLLSGLIGVAIAALLFVNVSAELAQSHHSMAMSHPTEAAPPADKPAKLQSQGLELQLSGDPSATVGQLAQFQVNVTETQTRQPVSNVRLKVTATQLENNWVTFAYEGIPDRTGKLAWQQQFFDGAPHKIEVEVAPQANATQQFQPFQVAQTIPVEGVAPPLPVRLISLTYFTGIVGVGLLLGLRFRQLNQPESYANVNNKE